MFLSAEPKNIEDFLLSLSFIPPINPQTKQPYDIKYFILPIQASGNTLPNKNTLDDEFQNQLGDFFRGEANLQPLPGGGPGAITYPNKQLNQTHSFGDSNFDIAAQPGPMPKNPTKPEMLTSTLQTYGGEIESNQKLDRINPRFYTDPRIIANLKNRPSVSIVENTPYSMTLQLKENFNVFPKNTLFCLKKAPKKFKIKKRVN
jgi:hypothetical protein